MIFTGLSCKSTMNLYCAKCYKCNKNDFWREKKTKREMTFFSLLAYCSEQPNASDTAVRLCSYTLTLRVLGDSDRMNHSTVPAAVFNNT